MFRVYSQSLFFNQNQGISLKPLAVFGTDGEDIVLSETAMSLFPMLVQELAGKLFLITEEGTNRECFGSGAHESGVKYVIGPLVRPSEMRTAVLGRFAPSWENVPVVERAFALMLDGRYSEMPQEWSDISLTRLTGELAGYFGTMLHSTVLLRVGPEEVLKQFPEHGYLGYVRQDVLVHALLALPVAREELAETPYIVHEWIKEDLENAREVMSQCEAEQRKATKAFEDVCDDIMKKRRPLRDRERLHQAWLQANPEPEPVAESATEPPAA